MPKGFSHRGLFVEIIFDLKVPNLPRVDLDLTLRVVRYSQRPAQIGSIAQPSRMLQVLAQDPLLNSSLSS